MIEKTFTSTVIQSKVLAPHQAGQLLGFMMDNTGIMWDSPEELDAGVRQRLRDAAAGNDAVKMGQFIHGKTRLGWLKFQLHSVHLSLHFI